MSQRWVAWASAWALALGGCREAASTPPDGESVSATNTPAAEAGGRKSQVNVKEERSGEWSPGLSDREKQTLFEIAEDTLDWCVNKREGRFGFDKYELTPKLKEPMATFVTLKIQGRLRGCIGSLAPEAPLYRSVHDNAVNAAMHDFRFRPVAPPELSKLEVHVSVLSPIAGIESLDRFHLGEHGIIIEKGMRRAVYLPEVAPEQGWTKEETLSSLSEKAGMDGDAWREGAHFKIFSSVVLSK
jgi:AmmeMemoRadiSam system protein A